ncbi:hypothetical protein ACFFX0_11335 [Citricoccus parietis]|uniref:Uncharacterized protein n=1 Tax=Citricoccus parietis TaxID=592307 RepID=A0ABV5FYK0_9MICC
MCTGQVSGLGGFRAGGRVGAGRKLPGAAALAVLGQDQPDEEADDAQADHAAEAPEAVAPAEEAGPVEEVADAEHGEDERAGHAGGPPSLTGLLGVDAAVRLGQEHPGEPEEQHRQSGGEQG